MFQKMSLIIWILCLVFVVIPFKGPNAYGSWQGSSAMASPKILSIACQISSQKDGINSQGPFGLWSMQGIWNWMRDRVKTLMSSRIKEGNGSFSTYFFNALFNSLLIILLALIIWRLGLIGIRSLSKHTKFLKTRYPDFKKRLTTYIRIIQKLFNTLIWILLILFLLEAWGIRALRFLSKHANTIYSLIRIPLTVVLAMVLIQISRFLISKIEVILENRMKARPGLPKIEISKQIHTVGELIYKTALITIWIVAAMMILKELGFDIKPILAGAGIVGLAVGFGAQNLVRDVISGLFMIIENQVRVGDVAILNGTGGLVEAINLRTTVLRGLDGALHIFPNGTINTLSNLTHNFSFYLFDIGVAYKEDMDRVVDILKKLSDEVMADPTYGPEILEPLEILGLDKFADSAIIIKARIKTKPIKQWMVGREMNRRIKKRFDEEGIEIPFPHRTVYFGEASPHFDIRMEGNKTSEDLVKRWIKEALEAHGQKGEIKG